MPVFASCSTHVTFVNPCKPIASNGPSGLLLPPLAPFSLAFGAPGSPPHVGRFSRSIEKTGPSERGPT